MKLISTAETSTTLWNAQSNKVEQLLTLESVIELGYVFLVGPYFVGLIPYTNTHLGA
jgi:hypothetical protein